jgi:hypothetical protein
MLGMTRVTRQRHNHRLHLTACGTLAPDWHRGSAGIGDVGC